ncbi:hypothetical protein ACFL2H_08445, partial [Planctomycetota bacterium]
LTILGSMANLRIQGALRGRLGDSFDRITLQSPGTPPAADPANIPYYFEDEVLYDDAAPWPNADGSGRSLNRRDGSGSGNNPGAWIDSAPSPGTSSFIDLPSGDVNGNGEIEVTDIDAICGAIQSGNNDMRFDLNGDGVINVGDQRFLVEQIMGTTYGDSNLDGIFNSSDFVQVFTVGEYEDGIAGNSTWAEGDWDCDGDFGTSDFVAAFQTNAYVANAVPTVETISIAASLQRSDDRVIETSDVDATGVDATDDSGDTEEQRRPVVLEPVRERIVDMAIAELDVADVADVADDADDERFLDSIASDDEIDRAFIV